MVRNTKQKTLILEAFRSGLDHPTAEEVYRFVKERLPSISLGTVYRNLDRMVEDGVLSSVDGGTRRRFDFYTERHYHFRCLDCGKVEDLPEALALKDVPPDHEWMRGRILVGSVYELHGYCPECARDRGQKE